MKINKYLDKSKRLSLYSSRIHNIKVNVISSDEDFLNFVKLNIPEYKDDKNAIEINLTCEFLGYFDISNHLFKSENFYENENNGSIVSSGISLGNKSLYWNSSRINISLLWNDDDQYIVKGSFLERLDHTLRRILLRQKWYKYNNYQIILRSLVYMPLFWILENYSDIFVLHGAAIANSKRSIILCGLNGVGKSTLALKLVMRDYKLLGDNYLLYNESKVYSFLEGARISKDLIREIGIDYSHEIKLYGKYLVPASFFPSISETVPDVFLFPIRGKDTRIREISVKKAVDLIIAQNDYLAEFPEHSYIGLLTFNDIFPDKSMLRVERKIEKLKQLLSKCKIGILQIGENEKVDNIISEIDKFYESK